MARADRTSWRDLCNTLEHHHGFCSQLPIGDGSAPGLYAMVKKQLNGLGINTWVDEERDVPPNLVTFWCFATDQGGDIVATRRLIQQDMASIPKHIPFEADCLFHVYQLAFGGSLRCADALAQTLCGFDVGYAQTMSVLMHVWREKARTWYTVWHSFFPQTSHLVHCMPPVLLSGRWGSCATCEAFLLRLPANELLKVLEACCLEDTGTNSGKKKPSMGRHPDDSCANVMSKNKQRIVALLPKFQTWHHLLIMHSRARQPLE